MFKKFLSLVLALMMVVGMTSTLAFSSTGENVKEIDLEKAADEGKTLAELGFTLNTNSTLTSKFEVVTKPTEENADNKAIKATLQMGYMFATAEEKAQINEASVVFLVGAKAIRKTLGGNDYYITLATNGTKRWHLIKDDASGNETVQNPDGSKNYLFAPDGTPVMGSTNASELKLPVKDMVKFDNSVNYKGLYRVGFKAMNKAIVVNDGFILRLGNKTNTRFVFSKDKVTTESTNNTLPTVAISTGEHQFTSFSTAYVGKDSIVVGNFTDETKIAALPQRQAGVWHDYRFDFDYSKGIYRIYIDGKHFLRR